MKKSAFLRCAVAGVFLVLDSFAAPQGVSPESLGVPSAALSAWIDDLSGIDHPRDCLVLRRGRRVAAGSWRGVLRDSGQTNEGAFCGRTPIGGLTRLLVHVAAGIAVDTGKMKADAHLDALMRRMLTDTRDGELAADELSALVERSVGESTAAFVVANFMNRIEGGLIHNWTAEAQAQDRRLMKGWDGGEIEVANLGRIADCLLHEGRSGKRSLVSADWLRRYPIRTAAYGGNVMILSPEKEAVVIALTSAKSPEAVVVAGEKLLATFAAAPLPENPAVREALDRKCRALVLPPEQVERRKAEKLPPSLGERTCLLDLKPYGQYRRNSEGDLIALKDGRLMLLWSRMMGSTSDDARSDICRRYSADGGRTWTDSEVVFTTPKGALNVMCVSLLRLSGGDIALAYLLKTSERDCRPLYYVSSDEGETWKGPVQVIPDSRRDYYVVNNARLVQLGSGRLVIPSCCGRRIEHWLSDDEGRTWRCARNSLVGNKPNGLPMRMEEPGTIELKDGRLMTYIRTDADWQYVTISSDGGETWSPVAAGTLRSPRSPAVLARLSDGRIAVVWNDHERYPENRFKYPYHNGSRAPLTLAFSEDEGKTWKDHLDLETDGWNSYPFVREIGGRLLIGYSYGGGLNSLRLVPFDLKKQRFPRVWMSLGGVRTTEEFEKAVRDCKAHGVDVVACGGDEKALVDRLAVCRRHGVKVFVGVEDASKRDREAKKTGRYELAVMSGGCYRRLAIDRNLFSFTPGRHEIVIEPPVYSKGQAYAKAPHYYMLGDGHYFGGYVPTGKAEIVVPEKLFDGRQHLRILPAKVEPAPPGAVPENDSAKDLAGTTEIRSRKLLRLSFDLTGLEHCRLDKVGIAVYWKFDDSVPNWKSERASYSVFSPITRERMRAQVREELAKWTRANGGTFPSDVVVAIRLGDEIFNATGWVNCPAASYPLWDYSASALADFARNTPEGVTYPRTWGANDVYGGAACGQFLYRFHKAAADYLKGAVEEAHAASPAILAFRNTTRGGAWCYANDHDGSGQELQTQVLDFVHVDPYPISANGYDEGCIPFDMAYMTGLARRYGKPVVPWLQAHAFPACGLVHPDGAQVRKMYGQHARFRPDGLMWLGYRPGKRDCTFPDNSPSAWEEAARVHAELKASGPVTRSCAELAVVRPYTARAEAVGRGNTADERLCRYVRERSVRSGGDYDVFEVPPFPTKAEREKLAAELKAYKRVVSCVDWPGIENVVASPRKGI